MYKETTEGIVLQIQVLPNAPKSQIIGEHNQALKIKIKSPPVDGKANEEIIRFFSQIFQISKSKIEVLRGEKSKIKSILVRGLNLSQVKDAIQKQIDVQTKKEKSHLPKLGLGIPFLIITFASAIILTSSPSDASEINNDDEVNSKSGQVYIDPDVKVENVYSEPGKTWEDCKKNMNLCVAWPDTDSFIKTIPGQEKTVKVKNPVTDKFEDRRFIKVRVQYERPFKKNDGTMGLLAKDTEGWIEADRLRLQNLESVYAISKSTAKSPLPQQRKPVDCKDTALRKVPTESTSSAALQVSQKLKDTFNINLEKTTESILPLVGKCPLPPPPQKKLDRWEDKNIYDVEVLPLMRSTPVPKDVRNKENLVSIDALARTIYSEMNGCFKMGIQYPMAVAKVVLNRKKLLEQNRSPIHFFHGPHHPESTPIQTLVTAKHQFSVWNYIGARNPNDKTVLMSLCPTRAESSKHNWKSEVPNPEEVENWKTAVKIATEAVLYPDSFQSKTSHLTQYYYTSGMRSYNDKNLASPRPSILGRPVQSLKCMYLWEGV